MTRVVVTGANGFLATNVIIELLSRGYLVRGILRDLNSFNYRMHSNLELIQGDFTEEIFIEKAIRGCDYVIHAAAITDQSLARYSDYHRVNVAAVENLITIAIREKVKRFVYIGSANAIGYGSKEKPGDEQQPARKPFTSSFYAISKLRGQQAALAFSDKIDVVVVNPAFMLGPYDSKPGSGKIILLGYKKKLIFYPPGGKNFVHVQDVATGVVSALETGRNGEAYLLANENLSYREFFKKLSAITNSRPVMIGIPKPLLLIAGLIGNLLKLMGFKSMISMANMNILCTNGFYINQKAKNELGIKFRSTGQALQDALEWFKEKKMI
jgi:dihydroflavonol-4-reductase